MHKKQLSTLQWAFIYLFIFKINVTTNGTKWILETTATKYEIDAT
jgi:hypothetical protein